MIVGGAHAVKVEVDFRTDSRTEGVFVAILTLFMEIGEFINLTSAENVQHVIERSGLVLESRTNGTGVLQ